MHEKNKEICLQNKLFIAWTMIHDNTQGKKKIVDYTSRCKKQNSKMHKQRAQKKKLHSNYFMTNYQLMSLVSVRP
jgi:hypothetical protein